MKKSELRQLVKEEIGKVLNENQNILSTLEQAGLNFDDGILGGVGSGGGGYYDDISDKISGYNLDKFDERSFNAWYNSINKDSLNSHTYESEFSEENEDGIDYEFISNKIKPGIYDLGDNIGYAEIISDGSVTVYAIPSLDGGNFEYEPIFSLDSNGNIKPKMSKEKVKSMLKQNTTKPGSYAIL
jgi:hypothetical protein